MLKFEARNFFHILSSKFKKKKNCIEKFLIFFFWGRGGKLGGQDFFLGVGATAPRRSATGHRHVAKFVFTISSR